MKKSDLGPIAAAIATGIKAAIAPLQTRNAEFERRIAALESRPLQKWSGVHVAGMEYSEASLVTRAGSLWVAMKTTTTTPGDGGGDWRLVVKRGHA